MSGLQPDHDVIQSFLQHTADHWIALLDGRAAVLEISVIDTNGGGRFQRSFAVTPEGIAEAARWAAEQNTKPGHNLYWVPQPKLPDARDKFASSVNILGMAYLYVDIDDDVAWVPEDLPLSPSLVVMTGTVPHERRHLYFPLAGLEKYDGALHERLITACRGDLGAKGPPRLMRLPGTISWPSSNKQERGYCDELTSWTTLSPDRGYSLSDIAAACPSARTDETRQGKCERADALIDFGRSRLPITRHLIDELYSRRNTIPKGGYAAWRDIGFGVRHEYRGTDLEDKAREAFFDFSRRWKNGTTEEHAIEKLWRSEGGNTGKPVTAGSAFHHLRGLPIRPPANTGAHGCASADTDRSDPALFQFTGLAERLHELSVMASEREPSDLQTAGVLTALSALFGPCGVIVNGVKGQCCTNLYVLCLAQTGAGKESTRTLASSLLAAANREGELADGSPSDVSFHQSLVDNSGRITLAIDEAGILLEALKAQSQSWQRLFMSMLMKAYGLGLTKLNKRTYRDKGKSISAVDRPRPTVLLTSTTSEFANAITQSDSSSGFLNRLLPIILRQLPPLRAQYVEVQGEAIIELPADVVAIAERFSGVYVGPQLPAVLPVVEITLTKEAREHLINWRRETVEPRIIAGGITGDTWNRAVENVQRVAGLLAMSDAVMEPAGEAPSQRKHQAGPNEQTAHANAQDAANARCGISTVSCEITHIELAISIVSRGLDSLAEIAKCSGERKTRIEYLKDKVLQKVREAGVEGASLTELGRGPLRSLGKAAERQELLNTMVNDGEIVVVDTDDGSGRPSTCYRLPEAGST